MPLQTDLRQQLLAAVDRQRWPDVERLAIALSKQRPSDAEAYFFSGIAAGEQRRIGDALSRLDRAVALAPQLPQYRAQLARYCSMVNQMDKAIAEVDAAVAAGPKDAMTFDTLGVVLSQANRHARAVAMFDQAVAKQPAVASYQFNRASSLKFLGRFDEAEQAYEACIAVNRHFWKAHSALAQLRKQSKSRHHLQRLNTLLPESRGNADAELHVRMALFKEHEDIGDYAVAFAHLQAGKSARRTVMRYDVQRDLQLFATVRRCFDSALHPPQDRAPTGPIFVVGMPRSGTTLIERILSSHSQVVSVGESQNFSLAVKRITATPGAAALDVETIRASSTAEAAPIGHDYQARTQPAADSRRIVDKTPLNFFHAALILKALPDARIVCLRRNPLDTCLSNFRQLFALQYSYYDYAYDLLDTGRYFLAFDNLVRHWRTRLGSRFMEMEYESMITNQESETRRLLEFCGLPWEPSCLQFENNKSPVATASAVQVRSPIYRDAVARWRRYERELAPLRTLLESNGVSCG